MAQDEILDYFERELSYLREDGAEFARKYPKIATRLELNSAGSPDPHVERLIESFAFLTARIQKKIDDESPELTEALLSLLEPHLLMPLPSLAVAELRLDPKQGRNLNGLVIPREASLLAPSVGGVRCRFQTCYETTLWPIEVVDVSLRSPQAEETPPSSARSVLRLTLRAQGGASMHELGLSSLRFFLHGPEQRAHHLYEYLLEQVRAVHVHTGCGGAAPVACLAARDVLRPVGFESHEGLLRYSERTRLGARLILEYFIFPQKYLFVDVGGLAQVIPSVGSPELTLLLYSDSLPPLFARELDPSAFRLGCTPIVNLFRRSAEPIQATQRESSYQIVPDRFKQSSIETCSVARVRGTTISPRSEVEYRPFYSIAHCQDRLQGEQVPFWYVSRRQSFRKEGPAYDLMLNLVSPSFQPQVPSNEKLLVDIWCTNHDLPSRLPFGEGRNDFVMEGVPLGDVYCLTKPTPSRRLETGRGLQWRLISLMALTSLSISDPEYGVEALKELLTVYDFRDDNVSRRQISGLHQISSRAIAARVREPGGLEGLAWGVEVMLSLQASHFIGASMYLFSSVIERYLGSSVPINTFCKLKVKLHDQEEALYSWTPRIGQRRVL